MNPSVFDSPIERLSVLIADDTVKYLAEPDPYKAELMRLSVTGATLELKILLNARADLRRLATSSPVPFD